MLVGGLWRHHLNAAQLCTINYPPERSVPLHAFEKVADVRKAARIALRNRDTGEV